MLWKKKEKGNKKEKKENYIKKGRKGLKNASFWTINRPPQTFWSGNKILSRKRGGDDQNAQYIPLGTCEYLGIALLGQLLPLNNTTLDIQL